MAVQELHSPTLRGAVRLGGQRRQRISCVGCRLERGVEKGHPSRPFSRTAHDFTMCATGDVKQHPCSKTRGVRYAALHRNEEIKMVDFHSHILPAMDDGSSSVEESIEMLRLSYRGGIRKMAATPHFYAQKEAPERFLERREAAWGRLAPMLPEDSPRIMLGAEVCFYAGISNTEALPQLCLEQSRLLLLEMPFQRWSERMTAEAVSIARDRGLTVLLAHIDRYLALQPPDIWDELAANGILFQVNASAFLGSWLSRRKVYKLLREGKIAALGSDCHNMRSRKPNLDAAVEAIGNKMGQETARRMEERAERLLADVQSPVGI